MKYLLSILMTFSALTSFGTHGAGLEIYYKYRGGSTYSIYINIYRGCNGIYPTNSLAINFTNLDSGSTAVSSALLIDSLELLDYCSSAITDCNGGILRGHKKYTYVLDTIFPTSARRINIGTSLSARTSDLTTISIPTGNNLFVEAFLDRSTVEHSSAEFTFNEELHFPMNGYSCMNQISIPEPGFSYHYFLRPALNGPNTPVNYISGYSFDQPISGIVELDSTSGLFCVYPTSVETGVYVVEVDQYLSNMLIGSVKTDRLIYVINDNTKPVLSGFDGLPFYHFEACVGHSNCFSINSSDADLDPTIIIEPSNLPFTFNHSSIGQNETVAACWTPTMTDLQNSPLTFTLEVKDDHCPYFQTRKVEFTINVVDSALSWCRTVGIDNKSLSNSFLFYPNPGSGRINLLSHNSGNVLVVYNNFGRICFNKNLDAGENSIETDLPSGIYYFELRNHSEIVLAFEKMVIIKE